VLLSCHAWPCPSPGGAAAPAQTTTYKWSDIDCGQSRIASWPGLKCEATNVVTAEGNVGSFRQLSTYGHTSEGYIQIFRWEAQDSFGFINTSEKTADFPQMVLREREGRHPLLPRRPLS